MASIAAFLGVNQTFLQKELHVRKKREMAWCATHFSHLDLLTQRYTMLAVPSIRQDEVSLYDIILGGSKFQLHIFLSYWIGCQFFTLFCK